MTREDIRVILNSEDEQDDKITLLLNRLNAEKSQIKANPEAQRKVEELEEKLNSTNDKMRSLRRELNEANKSLIIRIYCLNYRKKTQRLRDYRKR